MAGLFPKYHELICDTYTPNFVAGATPCTMSSENVSRSRLVAGGTFFRSIEHGAVYPNNSIILECIVTLVSDISDIQTYDVVFNVTDKDGIVTPYTFQQKYNSDLSTCITNGVTTLRDKLATNPIVNMPIIDVIEPWDAATDDNPCLLTSFSKTALDGGVGLPIPPPTIRTGPTFTLYHANLWDGNDDGTSKMYNKIFEWDGVQWIAHPSILYPIDSPPPCP